MPGFAWAISRSPRTTSSPCDVALREIHCHSSQRGRAGRPREPPRSRRRQRPAAPRPSLHAATSVQTRRRSPPRSAANPPSKAPDRQTASRRHPAASSWVGIERTAACCRATGVDSNHMPRLGTETCRRTRAGSRRRLIRRITTLTAYHASSWSPPSLSLAGHQLQFTRNPTRRTNSRNLESLEHSTRTDRREETPVPDLSSNAFFKNSSAGSFSPDRAWALAKSSGATYLPADSRLRSCSSCRRASSRSMCV